jgi:prophage DNA circulation protein
MSIELIAIFGLVVLMGILLVFMNLKDKEVNAKLNVFEKSIEALNKNVFELKNTLSATKIQLSQASSQANKISKDTELNLEKSIDAKLKEVDGKLEEVISETKSLTSQFMGDVTENVRLFKEKTKEINNITNAVTSSGSEKEIVSLFQQGKTTSEIARNLRIGIGEVELTLKLAGLV